MQQAARISDRTAFFTVAESEPATSSSSTTPSNSSPPPPTRAPRPTSPAASARTQEAIHVATRRVRSQLQHVHDELLLIGSMVEKAIKRSIESLRNRDVELAHRIVEDDDDIDERYLALEELCIDLIATQQPMAGDLRVVITGMQVASELERMGDYAEGIAKVSIRMGDDPPLKPLIDIPRMADISIGMLRRSLTALNDRDDALARQVWHADDEVDQLYDQVFRELLTFMFQNPRNIQRATWLLWVAHNLERIGDRPPTSPSASSTSTPARSPPATNAGPTSATPPPSTHPLPHQRLHLPLTATHPSGHPHYLLALRSREARPAERHSEAPFPRGARATGCRSFSLSLEGEGWGEGGCLGPQPCRGPSNPPRSTRLFKCLNGARLAPLPVAFLSEQASPRIAASQAGSGRSQR